MGGFGNQLFIFSAGYALARQHGLSLQLNTKWFSEERQREFELVDFSSTYATVERRHPEHSSIRGRKLPILAVTLANAFQGFYLHQERRYQYDAIDVPLDKSVRLFGYFQSWKYFRGWEHEISQLLQRIETPSAAYAVLNKELASKGDWIALHVRCGDFMRKDLLSLHGYTSPLYYTNALQLLRSQVGEVPIVVFSDEPECARRVLNGISGSFIFLDEPEIMRPIEWINLMAVASGMVTANSSFSWWGAWLLQQNRRAPVVCPRPWFAREGLDDRDLIPDSWMALGRDYDSYDRP